MQKWELAKYLIDAKKDVDSVWYIAENVPIIANINLREKEESVLRDFYVNCCNVLDKSFPKKRYARMMRLLPEFTMSETKNMRIRTKITKRSRLTVFQNYVSA